MRRPRLAGVLVLTLGAITLSDCSRPAPATAAAPQPDLEPVVSVRELMTHWIDPLSDNIFDAVGVEVTKDGTKETRPVTDEDWAKVEQGAIALAEGANLLKIRRPVAPSHDNVSKNPGELPPDDIQQRVESDPRLWNSHVDQLRDEAIKVLEIAKKRDTDALFQAGTNIDRACETCHLEYWYPGDREAVERDRRSAVIPGKSDQ
jgi:hypothetical protein